jgi:hypothetical protein
LAPPVDHNLTLDVTVTSVVTIDRRGSKKTAKELMMMVVVMMMVKLDELQQWLRPLATNHVVDNQRFFCIRNRLQQFRV